MPIVDIAFVTAEDGVVPCSAQALADALGGVFRTAPGRVWVRLEALPTRRYAENGEPAGVQPVFVKVMHADMPAVARLRDEAAAIAAAVAGCSGRAVDLVHVEYAPAGRGRVAFGGRLLE